MLGGMSECLPPALLGGRARWGAIHWWVLWARWKCLVAQIQPVSRILPTPDLKYYPESNYEYPILTKGPLSHKALI